MGSRAYSSILLLLFVLFSFSWSYACQNELVPRPRDKDDEELHQLQVFCQWTEINNILLLVEYGLQVFGNDDLVHDFEKTKKKISGCLSPTQSEIERIYENCKNEFPGHSRAVIIEWFSILRAEKILREQILDLVNVLKLSKRVFFYKKNAINDFQSFFCHMAGYAPFIFYFLGYCLKQEPGTLFSTSPDVFDENSSDYIDIEHILELLNKQLIAYGKHVNKLGTPITIGNKEIALSPDACNKKVQKIGKKVIQEIKTRHKKVSEQNIPEKVLHKVASFDTDSFGDPSDEDDESEGDDSEEGCYLEELPASVCLIL